MDTLLKNVLNSFLENKSKGLSNANSNPSNKTYESMNLCTKFNSNVDDNNPNRFHYYFVHWMMMMMMMMTMLEIYHIFLII